MNDHRQILFLCQPQLTDEPFPLNFFGVGHPIIIQTDFPHRHDFIPAAVLPKLLHAFLVQITDLTWMDSRRSVYKRIFLNENKRAEHIVPAIADIDNPLHSGVF